MIRVIGTRRSGKTTRLLSLAAENGYVIVEPNARMADYVRHMATEKGLNVNVISAYELPYRQHSVVREKYLVDELRMFMESLGIVGYSDGPNVTLEPFDNFYESIATEMEEKHKRE